MRVHDKSKYVLLENKAYIFLYPLLGLKHFVSAKPIQCYIYKYNDTSEYRLHLLYYNREDEQFKNFLSMFLFKHDFYLSHEVINDYLIVTFNLEHYKNTHDKVLSSKFSEIEIENKIRLESYYKDTSVNRTVESYLIPYKYKNEYSFEFNSPVEVFPNELCSKINLEKETLKLQDLYKK